MKLKNRKTFFNTARNANVKSWELRIITRIKGEIPISEAVSIDDIDEFLHVNGGSKKNFEPEVIELVKKVRLIISEMTQNGAMEYKGKESIEANLDDVVKGILEGVMRDFNEKILRRTMRTICSMNGNEARFKEIMLIELLTREMGNKIRNYIFKLNGDNLIAATVSLPDYTLIGASGEKIRCGDWVYKGEIRDCLEAEEELLLEIQEAIRTKGQGILEEIYELNRITATMGNCSGKEGLLSGQVVSPHSSSTAL
jgi:hypothetical protein